MQTDMMYEMIDKIVSYSGMTLEELLEAGKYGASMGWPKFTYDSDLMSFWDENSRLIENVVDEYAHEVGDDDYLSYAVNNKDRLGIYSIKTLKTALVWMAFEIACQWLADHKDPAAAYKAATEQAATE